MSRTLLLALIGTTAMAACTSITVVRVPNGTRAGSPGSELPPKTILPCKVLDSDKRGDCVLTVDECKYGIGVVRSDRKGRNTEVVIQCFVPNASDPGTHAGGPGGPTDDGGDSGL